MENTDPFEQRVLTYLTEKRGSSFTVFQIANNVGTAGAGVLLGGLGASSASGYAVGIQIVRNALENLVNEGYVNKSVTKRGVLEEIYYSAK